MGRISSIDVLGHPLRAFCGGGWGPASQAPGGSANSESPLINDLRAAKFC